MHIILMQAEQWPLYKPLIRKLGINPDKPRLKIKKGRIETANRVSFGWNPSFWTGLLSLLTFQSQVTFNYPMTQRAGQPASRLDCLPGPTWSRGRREQTLRTGALTLWEIAAARQSGVCSNCLSWRWMEGPVIFSTFPTWLISSGQRLSQ